VTDGSYPVLHTTAPLTAESRVIVWQAGTPHTGALLAPVRAIATALGRELVCVARPGDGGSPRLRGRSVADGVGDVVDVLQRFDLHDAVVVGYSGGGPHALAIAAAEPTRIRAAVVVGCPAPYHGDPAWFEGMVDDAALRSALGGGTLARDAHPEAFDSRSFIARDHAALEGSWGALGEDAGAADATADGGVTDDDVAFVTDWAFSLEAVRAPVRIVHGRLDRVIPVSHAPALGRLIPHAVVTIHDEDGHVSVLEHLEQHLRAVLT